MKISPKSKRLDDELEVVIVKGISKAVLFMIFPSIYLVFMEYLENMLSFKGRHIIVKTDMHTHIQYDGEAYYPRNRIEVKRSNI